MVHLDQCFLHARLPPAIALDNRRLERELAQLGHLQGDFARLGLQRTFVVPGTRVQPVRAVLIALRSAQLVRLRVQHRIKGLFHGRSHHLTQVLLHQLLVDLDHLSHRLIGRRGASRVHRVFSHCSGFQFGLSGYPSLRHPSQNVRNMPDVITTPLHFVKILLARSRA